MERAILSLSPANVITIWIMVGLLYFGALGVNMLFGAAKPAS